MDLDEWKGRVWDAKMSGKDKLMERAVVGAMIHERMSEMEKEMADEDDEDIRMGREGEDSLELENLLFLLDDLDAEIASLAEARQEPRPHFRF